jgi:hypothetical protein
MSLDQSLTQKNIKSGFKVTRIWPLNPKATNHKIKPFKFYTITLTNISDEDSEGLGQKQWGENGLIT